MLARPGCDTPGNFKIEVKEKKVYILMLPEAGIGWKNMSGHTGHSKVAIFTIKKKKRKKVNHFCRQIPSPAAVY